MSIFEREGWAVEFVVWRSLRKVLKKFENGLQHLNHQTTISFPFCLSCFPFPFFFFYFSHMQLYYSRYAYFHSFFPATSIIYFHFLNLIYTPLTLAPCMFACQEQEIAAVYMQVHQQLDAQGRLPQGTVSLMPRPNAGTAGAGATPPAGTTPSGSQAGPSAPQSSSK